MAKEIDDLDDLIMKDFPLFGLEREVDEDEEWSPERAMRELANVDLGDEPSMEQTLSSLSQALKQHYQPDTIILSPQAFEDLKKSLEE